MTVVVAHSVPNFSTNCFRLFVAASRIANTTRIIHSDYITSIFLLPKPSNSWFSMPRKCLFGFWFNFLLFSDFQTHWEPCALKQILKHRDYIFDLTHSVFLFPSGHRPLSDLLTNRLKFRRSSGQFHIEICMGNCCHCKNHKIGKMSSTFQWANKNTAHL